MPLDRLDSVLRACLASMVLSGCALPPNDTFLGGYDASTIDCTAICVRVSPQLQSEFGFANPECGSAEFTQATSCSKCRTVFENKFGVLFVSPCEELNMKSDGGDGADGGPR